MTSLSLDVSGLSRGPGSDLEVSLNELEGLGASFADRFIREDRVRQEYRVQLRRYVKNLHEDVRLGQLSHGEAAQRAQTMRNGIMDAMRGSSSELGLALAKFQKEQGLTMAELQQKYAAKIFQSDFQQLPPDAKIRVWALILRKAGEPNGRWNRIARAAGYSGRGLWALTLFSALHQVAVAHNKPVAIGQQLAVVGGGLAGSAALGPAGFACGPAAVVCVPVMVALGGVLGSVGAERLYDWLNKP